MAKAFFEFIRNDVSVLLMKIKNANKKSHEFIVEETISKYLDRL